jgi:putative endonuclease
MKCYVYLLISKEGYHYTGHTPDLDRRLMQHNTGCCHSTKRGSHWRIIHQEEFPTRSDAMKREKWLKTLDGRLWIRAHVPGWLPPSRGVESESE